ncbi:MAG: thermonuclease family protein [Actinomycetota bacterium]|nr:thermonuclease family protein [Actinomycetota bacterium]
MRRTLLCIALLAIACRPGSTPAPNTPTALQPNATMLRIVDGDTIDVTIDGRRERVRLIGIDTPETKKQNTPVQCFGPEATIFATSLLPADTLLHLERDVVARDDFGRMLAYVYLAGDGTFINMRIIREGYARPLTIPPNVAHADEFVEAARFAEADSIGLWARCTG